MKQPFRRFAELLKVSVANAHRHNVPRLSAALAFYAIFSLAPLLVIIVSLAGVVLGSDEVENRIVQESRNLVGNSAAKIVKSIVTTSRRPETNVIAFTASLLFLIFGASRVFVHMEGAMQTIWETQRGGIKNTVQNRLIGVGMVIGAVLALFVGVVTQTLTAAALGVIGDRWSHVDTLLVAADAFLAFSITAFLIAVVYRYLPRSDVGWGAAWSGAILATALFMLGRMGFGLYLRLGVAHTIQGAAGSLVVLVLWIYYVAQILFLGAEFTRARMLDLDTDGKSQ